MSCLRLMFGDQLIKYVQVGLCIMMLCLKEMQGAMPGTFQQSLHINLPACLAGIKTNIQEVIPDKQRR